MKTVIIDYGAGNLFSVQTALHRLGVRPVVSCDGREIRSADRIIFPGVGQASAAMERLRSSGLDRIIPSLEQPVLGICLGMQLLCAFTEEEETCGLGVFPLQVEKIREAEKVPHMGWNRISGLQSGLFEGVAESEWMYFVHSYCVPDNAYTIARCDYHRPFAAAIRRENFYGCQFHPEKSSRSGERILWNFIYGKIA